MDSIYSFANTKCILVFTSEQGRIQKSYGGGALTPPLPLTEETTFLMVPMIHQQLQPLKHLNQQRQI